MLLGVAFGYSQNTPVLKVKDKPLGLSSLDISVEIVGNIATTTFDMLFYNPTSNVLEGELLFPLGQGHDVSRFALDVNGRIREAVVVEKELGRIAFEQVVRREVDPALLEKGTGNSYKARIYPIPAKGYKRVILAYEQEVDFDGGEQHYYLPLNFKNRIENFKLKIVVFDQEIQPVIEKGKISGLDFKNWKKNYSTSVEKKNFIANQSLLIKIPIDLKERKVLAFEDYFYIYKILSPEKRLRKKPYKISILWDASISMKDRNLKKELNILASYFSHTKNLTVCFTSFSNTLLMEKEFIVIDGNWNTLRKEISKVIYDGGTSYNLKGFKNNKESDATFLFTDGIATLSDFSISGRGTIFIINSIVKANHSRLHRVAESSGGAYINLNKQSQSQALSKLIYDNFKFLGHTSNSKKIEVYPNLPTSIDNDFSISAKGVKKEDTITLHFGYGNNVNQSIEINLSDYVSNKNVKRLWSQKKLDFLEQDSKKNKQKIVKLGTTYDLVTDYTSLIVLEDVRDYVRYKITPPKELQEEYNTILKESKNDKKEILEFLSISPSLQSQKPPITQAANVVLHEVEEIVIQTAENDEVVTTNNFAMGTIEESNDGDGVPFMIIETPPIYPACQGDNNALKRCFSDKLRNHIAVNLDFSSTADLGLSGMQRIFVSFTINKKGRIKNIRIRSPHNKITQFTRSALRSLPRMIPGKQRGRPIDVKYTLPITFDLGDDGHISNLSSTSNYSKFKPYSGKLIVNDRPMKEKYITELSKTKTKEKAYKLYLKQRENYLKTPTYYIDVSVFFKERFNDPMLAGRIASNIAEMDFDNYELLKAYGYNLQANNQHNLALFIFNRILELRSEDSQSYRDLALAYENVGEYQKALDLLNSIATGKIYENSKRRIFEGIKLVSQHEIGRLVKKYKTHLDNSKIDKKLLHKKGYNVRIIVDWNHNDTDIDLHIIDPNLEECYYEHQSTQIGGKMSPDMTQGFGPEEFVLTNAIKGDYFVKIKYYGDTYQKVETPTFMKVTLFKNYGLENESKEIKIIRLTKADDKQIVAKLSFK